MENNSSAFSSLLHDDQHAHLMLMFTMWWREKNKKSQFILICNKKDFYHTFKQHQGKVVLQVDF
eukprot:7672803-Ditylum_brightwellii.AAC.1